ncbi:MAG TPA: methylmalonyl-CoA mutase family protein [Oligoflexia bacterium]|nr:methylmalonyl-CoA mutase family protein [Oligoflexia bacterium]HMP27474.1 methylmalonyl-CoA mutase family protein [Oligoflexia bacterium]
MNKSSLNKKSLSYTEWLRSTYATQKERKKEFFSISFREQVPLGAPEGEVSADYADKLGFPGEFPFTRGVQPTMYRGRLWTMRQFAGFGSAEDTNKRFKYLLEHGQTGLSTAFDMPSLMGYDPDHLRARGEVGREGVSVATIDDMERLFAGIDQTAVTTSMTINATAPIALAMYFVVARRRNVSWDLIGGTIQNDMLKEFIAQKEWIVPPPPSLKLNCDIIEFCAKNAKKFNPVSISGYHIREAGATAVQELAFTIADGIAIVEELLGRGLDVDLFAPRLSFFFDVHNDFFEEIAKFRAARRIWANLMRDRFQAKKEESMRLRTHAQTAGVSLTAQQPVNNVARVALQAMAAVLGGVQSLHTNSMDETLSLPTEEAVKVALRTQQIIAFESGVTNTIDPLGGSYYVEQLTDQIEAEAMEYISKIDQLGGMLKAVEIGFPQKEISEAAYRFQQRLDRLEESIVGVNCFVDELEQQEIPILNIDYQAEEVQAKRTASFKMSRDSKKYLSARRAFEDVLKRGGNIMPELIEAVDNGLTLGEYSDILRETFGIYSDPGFE